MRLTPKILVLSRLETGLGVAVGVAGFLTIVDEGGRLGKARILGCVDMVFGGPFVVRSWSVVAGLNVEGCRSFRRRQPLVLISYLIVANWI
jgi:hypothetical protein